MNPVHSLASYFLNMCFDNILPSMKYRRLLRAQNMGRTWGEQEIRTEFGWRNVLERDHLDDREGDGDNINMCFDEIAGKDGRWLKLAQDRAQWWSLVFAVFKLQKLIRQC
jgi:hypothetical protein